MLVGKSNLQSQTPMVFGKEPIQILDVSNSVKHFEASRVVAS